MGGSGGGGGRGGGCGRGPAGLGLGLGFGSHDGGRVARCSCHLPHSSAWIASAVAGTLCVAATKSRRVGPEGLGAAPSADGCGRGKGVVGVSVDQATP